jgi:hypothetical protein
MSDVLDSIRARAERSFDVLDDWSPGLDFPEGALPASPDQVLRLLAVAEAAEAFLGSFAPDRWDMDEDAKRLRAALNALEEK